MNMKLSMTFGCSVIMGTRLSFQTPFQVPPAIIRPATKSGCVTGAAAGPAAVPHSPAPGEPRHHLPGLLGKGRNGAGTEFHLHGGCLSSHAPEPPQGQ